MNMGEFIHVESLVKRWDLKLYSLVLAAGTLKGPLFRWLAINWIIPNLLLARNWLFHQFHPFKTGSLEFQARVNIWGM